MGTIVDAGQDPAVAHPHPLGTVRTAVSAAGSFRAMLFSRKGIVRIVGAHNPLGAKLAERAGFDGVWSSGLEVSASQGVPDTDILTMTELHSVAAAMADAVAVPVVADCDAGYGGISNVMRMVRKYESSGIAAVTMEDKTFPKRNSFIAGGQELVTIKEFCGKIAAAKHAQQDPDFVVIARTEALIAGGDLAEALERGRAYADAGADAVLIHSKDKSPHRVLEFLERWEDDSTPVVVVPTTYHSVTAETLEAAGARMVVYANHGLRASIAAVEHAFKCILVNGSSSELEDAISSIDSIFELQGTARVLADEERFSAPRRTAP
jgi:phosphoenolpyruvate phosphomutase